MAENEAELIQLARRYVPAAIRTLAEIARDTGDASTRKDSIAGLVAYRFLTTEQPDDDILNQIIAMTDEQILEACIRAMH